MDQNNNHNHTRVIAVTNCPICDAKLIPGENTIKEVVGVCPKGHGVFERYQRVVKNKIL